MERGQGSIAKFAPKLIISDVQAAESVNFGEQKCFKQHEILFRRVQIQASLQVQRQVDHASIG